VRPDSTKKKRIEKGCHTREERRGKWKKSKGEYKKEGMGGSERGNENF
jgi:hypothetical protein